MAAKLLFAALGVALNALLLGSGLVGYGALGAHEAVHCWTQQVIEHDSTPCHVAHYAYGSPERAASGHGAETDTFRDERPWEHWICYPLEGLAALGILLPGLLLCLLAIWKVSP